MLDNWTLVPVSLRCSLSINTLTMYKESTFKTWAVNDRPTTKVQNGANGASDAELLAVLLGNTPASILLARQILADAGGLSGLRRWGFSELTKYKGVNAGRAAAVIAALSLGRRSDYKEIKKVTESKDSYNAVLPLLDGLEVEKFVVVFANKNNRIIATEIISTGGMDAAVVDIRVILRRALELRATCLVLAHNHPSGDTIPSGADIALTGKVKQAAQHLDILVLDHIIVGAGSYSSFADDGRI